MDQLQQTYQGILGWGWLTVIFLGPICASTAWVYGGWWHAPLGLTLGGAGFLASFQYGFHRLAQARRDNLAVARADGLY